MARGMIGGRNRRWGLKTGVPLTCLGLLLAGCASPQQALVARQPKTPPARTISSFTEALTCMDNLMLASGKHDVFITSNGLPDATGKIAGGTKDMLITAVSRMSSRSNAFRFVDFEPALDDVNALYSLVGVQPDFRAPSYYIRGAITQLDENVLNESQSAALSLPQLDLAVSRDQVVSVISVDLNVGQLVTRQILPGMSASNSIAIVSAGAGGDAGGVINKAGLAFKVAFNKNEGFHQAVRTLVELSTIEVLGKLTRVPYWQCLGVERSNPTFQAQAREWFDGMTGAQKVSSAQAGLRAGGYYQGPDTGNLDDGTRAALARWQADNGLLANGQVDFDVYYRMLTMAGQGGTPQPVRTAAAEPPSAAPAPAPSPAAAPAPGPAPTGARTASLAPVAPPPASAAPDIAIASNHGPTPTMRNGETLSVRIRTSGNAYVSCYYKDGTGEVSRIFPNRFQPNGLVQAGQQVQIPPASNPFTIRMDHPGRAQAVTCLASAADLQKNLPGRYRVEDLTPMPEIDMPDVLDAYAAIPGGAVRNATLPIAVAN